ncbi:Cilia- and flagella-associated protein 91 like protein [Aduncisulcus paluster]|uniref:Cilia- and flagella-associated protein 91 n=1 Tax=Aduncisulcus paluster TaxID=2918883 RepID=A0ABQ5KVM3_9EUKA|nr:Cilia- and flagella-associated protein 91 like protein [Aduncisulcus paluster]
MSVRNQGKTHEWQPETIERAPIYRNTVNVGVQTVLRESSVQTDPWAPDYIYSGPRPEVLEISHLTFENNLLPPGQRTVELIKKVRKRREFEKQLPPVVDEKSFNERVDFLAGKDVEDWDDRKKDIEATQEEHLDQLRAALEKRQLLRDQHRAKRLASVHNALLVQKEEASNKIKRNRIAAMRRLAGQRKKDLLAGATPSSQAKGSHPSRRDVIHEFACHTSRFHAARMRDGVCPPLFKGTVTLPGTVLKTTEDLIDFSAGLPAELMIRQSTMGRTKKDLKKLINIEFEDISLGDALVPPPGMTLAEHKAQLAIIRGKRRQKGKKQGAAATQPTPAAQPAQQLKEAEEEEEKAKKSVDPHTQKKIDDAVRYIQAVVRGRAEQLRMAIGCAQRISLVRELLVRQRIHEEEERQEEELKQVEESKGGRWRDRSEEKEEDKIHIGRGEFVTIEKEHGDAEKLGQLLAAMDIDTLRRREHARMALLVKLTELQRVRREAAEVGRRSRELEAREKARVRYEQLMLIHRSSANMFLDVVVRNTVNKEAKRKAESEAEQIAAAVDSAECEAEKRFEGRPADAVRDLVQSLLYMQIDRLQVKKNVRSEQKKYLHAAKTALGPILDKIESKK